MGIFSAIVVMDNHQSWMGDYDAAFGHARARLPKAGTGVDIRPPRIAAKDDLNVPVLQPGVDLVTQPVGKRPSQQWAAYAQLARTGVYGDLPESMDSLTRAGLAARMVKLYPGLGTVGILRLS
jgi:hypothetical protein